MNARQLHGFLFVAVLVLVAGPVTGADIADLSFQDRSGKGVEPSQEGCFPEGCETQECALLLDADDAPGQQQRDRDRTSQTTQAAGGVFAPLTALVAGAAGIAAGRRRGQSVRDWSSITPFQGDC